MSTIKDVAQRAGVSVATASRVLRNIGYYKRETHERVVKAAESLAYIADKTAQQLKTNSRKAVGFIISNINNSYYISILSDLRTTLEAMNMDLVITFSSEDPHDEETAFYSLIADRVSAILFIPVSRTNERVIKLAQKNGIRIIQLFRHIYDDLDTIANDDEGGTYEATKYLLSLGCKRLLLVDVAYEHIDFNLVRPNRSLGFRQALGEYGDEIRSHIIHTAILTIKLDEFYDELNSFRPDGIISVSHTVLPLLEYIRKTSKNIRLVAFDDNDWLDFCSVTAIHQNRSELVQAIGETILSKEQLVQRQIAEQLVIRRNA